MASTPDMGGLGLTMQTDGGGSDSGSSDSSGSIWQTLIENGGDLLTGSASLLNAFNGKPNTTTVVTQPNSYTSAGSVMSSPLVWIIVGLVALVAVVMLFRR